MFSEPKALQLSFNKAKSWALDLMLCAILKRRVQLLVPCLVIVLAPAGARLIIILAPAGARVGASFGICSRTGAELGA